MLRTLLPILLFTASATAMAAPREIMLNTTADLRSWCQAESQAQLVGQGRSPYNWSASYWQDGNVLNVKGSWRVGDAELSVVCRVAKGASDAFATLVISPDK